MSTTAIAAPEGERAVRRRRLLGLGVSIGLHLAALAFFLSSHRRVSAAQGDGGGAMNVSLTGLRIVAPAPTQPTPPAPTTVPAPALPSPPTPPEPFKPRSVLAVVSDILSIPLPEQSVTPVPLARPPSAVVAQAMSQAAGSPGSACDIAGAVQAALSADPQIHGAVLLLPREGRTGANAVMLWNGQWIDPPVPDGAMTTATIRTAIRQIVGAAKPECREQTIAGPRFMLIPDLDRTLVVVIGEASWRCSDLLNDSDGSS